MNEKMKKDREMLKGLLTVFAILTAGLFTIAAYQTPLPAEAKPILKWFLAAIGVFLFASTIYIYKVSQWCYSSRPLSWAMAILFVVCAFQYGIITLIIAVVVLWKSKKIMTSS